MQVAQMVTGLALLRWLVFGALYLVGYRHPANMGLRGSNIEIKGQRRFMGLSLGPTLTVIPLRVVSQVRLVGQSSMWAVVAGVAALLLSSSAAAVLVLWGVAGSQPSWIAGGLLLVGLGVALDAAAYLVVVRSVRRGLSTIEVRARGFRSRINGVPTGEAEVLVARIREGL